MSRDETWSPDGTRLSSISTPLIRTTPSHRRGVACFTFDDGYATDYTVVRDEFNQRGMVASFFIPPGRLGAAGRMTSAQVAQLAADGHEIGSHTVLETDLTAATLAQRVTAYDDAKAQLEAIVGAGKVTTFSNPQGRTSDTIERELYLRHDRQVLVEGRPYLFERSRLPGFRIGRYPYIDTTHSNAMSMLTQVAQTDSVFVLYGHNVGDGTDLSTANLAAALDRCAQLGIEVRRVDDTFPSPTRLVNGGFEDGMLGWEKVSGQTAEVVTDTPADGLSGTKSLHIQNATEGATIVRSMYVPVEPSVPLTISGRVRVSITSGASPLIYLRAMVYDSAGTIISNTRTGTTSTTWATVTHAVTPASTARAVRVDCVIEGMVGEAWFDHIHVGPTDLGVYG